MNVSSSGYYRWVKRSPSKLEKANQRLIRHLHVFQQQGRGTYGTRRLKFLFARENLVVSRRRISRLMKKAGLYCQTKRKFKVTTDSKHREPISPNLLKRHFTVEKADRAYVGDITYLKISQGYLYLAVVIDLYSRQIVGWLALLHK